MKTGIILRSKEIFVLNYSARPKKIVFVVLMTKVFPTRKNPENHQTIFFQQRPNYE